VYATSVQSDSNYVVNTNRGGPTAFRNQNNTYFNVQIIAPCLFNHGANLVPFACLIRSGVEQYLAAQAECLQFAASAPIFGSVWHFAGLDCQVTQGR